MTRSIGVGLTYYTVRVSFFAVVLSYGFISSLGVGFAYVAPLAAGMKVSCKTRVSERERTTLELELH